VDDSTYGCGLAVLIVVALAAAAALLGAVSAMSREGVIVPFWILALTVVAGIALTVKHFRSR